MTITQLITAEQKLINQFEEDIENVMKEYAFNTNLKPIDMCRSLFVSGAGIIITENHDCIKNTKLAIHNAFIEAYTLSLYKWACNQTTEETFEKEFGELIKDLPVEKKSHEETPLDLSLLDTTKIKHDYKKEIFLNHLSDLKRIRETNHE